MYIVEIALFKKGLREELSFWSAHEYKIGTVVSAPIRGRYVLGLVLKCESLLKQKTEIKNAPFKLRKITSNRGQLPHDEFLIKQIIDFANKYAVPVSEILGDTISEDLAPLLMNYEPLQLATKSISYIHESRKTRFVLYKRFVRESLSNKNQNKKLVVICTPTKALANKIYNNISLGIEKHIVVASETNDKTLKTLKNILDSQKPVCLITNTKNALAIIPFIDILIIDDVNSRFYTNRNRPHLPYAELIIEMAKQLKMKTILCGSCLKTEQYLMVKNGELTAHPESNTRFLIDNSKINFELRDKNNWELFPAKAKKLINEVAEMNEKKLFIFSAKSGLFPTTICGDCKSILTCPICTAPLRLFDKKTGRQYSCPRCMHTESAEKICPKCNSWNLNPFGIGGERIYESLKEVYKDENVKILYIDEQKTTSEIKRLLKNWYEQGGILIGGERVLNKLENYPEYIIISSIDSLFGIPNYRISERIIEFILNTNDFASEKLHIITGLDDEYLFKEIKRGNLKMFYEDELSDRAELGFPPYGYLLNIKKFTNKNDFANLKKLFKAFDPSIEISAYSKGLGKIVAIATNLYTAENWAQKSKDIQKFFDQTFDIYVNETDWLN